MPSAAELLGFNYVELNLGFGHGLRPAPPRLERIQHHLGGLGGFSNKVEVLVISGRTVVGARVVPVTTWVSVLVVVGLAGSITGVSMLLSAPVTTGASGTMVSGAV